MATIDAVKQVLNESLQLKDRSSGFTEMTPLLGAIPELDSMAVVSVITGLEECFNFVIEDDEISAKAFETVGDLVDFVNQKLSDT